MYGLSSLMTQCVVFILHLVFLSPLHLVLSPLHLVFFLKVLCNLVFLFRLKTHSDLVHVTKIENDVYTNVSEHDLPLQ